MRMKQLRRRRPANSVRTPGCCEVDLGGLHCWAIGGLESEVGSWSRYGYLSGATAAVSSAGVESIRCLGRGLGLEYLVGQDGVGAIRGG